MASVGVAGRKRRQNEMAMAIDDTSLRHDESDDEDRDNENTALLAHRLWLEGIKRQR